MSNTPNPNLKSDSIKGILYLDFETFPVPVGDIAEPMDEGVRRRNLLSLKTLHTFLSLLTVPTYKTTPITFNKLIGVKFSIRMSVINYISTHSLLSKILSISFVKSNIKISL